VKASATSRAKIETVSSVRQAGTTPEGERAPSDGFSPTMPLSPAGTPPDPPVSLPSENGTRPAPTAVAEPELDPPGMRSERSALRGTPYGERTPTRPVANWSRLVFPMTIEPARSSFSTRNADLVGG